MYNDYLSLFAQNPDHLITLFFLTLCRVFPLMSLAPFFGAKVMPNQAKVGLSICLTFILLPFLLNRPDVVPIHLNAQAMGYALKEVMVGFLLGFLVTFPFMIAQMAGIVIDNQRGSSSLMVNDPTTSSQVSSIGLLYNYMTIIIFFSINGPFLVLDALVKSYQVIPLTHFISGEFFSLTVPFWKTIIGSLTYLTALSCQMAAPSLLMILMSNVFLGIINRLAPQVQITFLGMSLNAYLGDLAMWSAWFFTLEYLGDMSLNWVKQITDLIEKTGKFVFS